MLTTVLEHWQGLLTFTMCLMSAVWIMQLRSPSARSFDADDQNADG
jgi:hypothetical protein